MLNAQGIGKTIVVGATNEANIKVNSLYLLLGGTLKGCVFGGLKPKSDFPYLFDKYNKKVSHPLILLQFFVNKFHKK